jgi:hypothetical protein
MTEGSTPTTGSARMSYSRLMKMIGHGMEIKLIYSKLK